MAHSDSEDEALDDAEFDRTTEGDEDVDEDILDALEGDLAAAEEGTEGEDVCCILLYYVVTLYIFSFALGIIFRGV